MMGRWSRVIWQLTLAFLLVSVPRPVRAADDSGSQSQADESRLMQAADEAASAAAQNEAELGQALMADASAEKSLATGEEFYRKGDFSRALERLEAARRADPENARAALLLGLAHLRLDNPQAAAGQWRDFVKESKDPKLAGDVQKFVTILLQEANERGARDAVAREQQLSVVRTDPKTVAVGPFRNLGTEGYAPLGKALAAMLIDNLSAIPDVRVLEREQVQALVDEAKLAETGLVQETTAVRAGKLLRAGRVTAGSHIDFTRSPTQLRIEAVLVDVDGGTKIATASEEDQIERFHQLVPKIASSFVSPLTAKTVAQLPPEQRERVTRPHTRSLPAALAFGRVLEAKDNKDSAAALEACKEAEREDPDFELAKRTCLAIPPVWMSPEAVATAMETQLLVVPKSLAATVAPWVVGALAVGGAAGGAVAATSGGNGDGGGGGQITNEPGGNNAPGLQGVQSNVTIAAGNTLVENLSASDPDGQGVTLSAQNLPPGASFSQSAGIVTGRFTFTPSCDQAGQTFTVTFCATDNGSPPASTCQDSRIRVTECPPPEQPTPTPTPLACKSIPETCNNPGQCCSNNCGETDNNGGDVDSCCVPDGGACPSDPDDCCGVASDCDEDGKCCLGDGQPCAPGSNCCSGACYFGTCPSP